MVIAAVFGASTTISVSYAQIEKNVIFMLFTQSLFSFIASFRPKKIGQSFKNKKALFLMAIRSIGGLLVHFFYFKGLEFKDPVISAVLIAIGPVLVPLLLVYKKSLNLKELIALLGCFIGLVIFKDINISTFKFDALFIYGLLSAFFFGLTIVIVDELKKSYSTTELVGLYALFSLLVTAPLAISYLDELTFNEGLFYLLMAMLFFLRQTSMYQAMKFISPELFGALTYLSIPMIATYDVLIKGKRLSTHQAIGAIVIIISILFLQSKIRLFRKKWPKETSKA